VFPILHWNYKDVWQFLKGFNLEYCPLYDIGYTSLGEIHNSVQNPCLKEDDGSFRPAYMLRDDEQERFSRVWFWKVFRVKLFH